MNHVGLYGMIVDEKLETNKDDEGVQINFTVSNLRRIADDQKEITYVPIRAYDWLAEIVALNGKKGDFVLIEGKLVQNEATNRDGTKTFLRLEIEATKILFLDQRRLTFPDSYKEKNLTNR